MFKKILAITLCFALTLSLGACRQNAEEQYMSGVRFDPAEYDTATYARYENQLCGIIIEYPESYERLGNFELDGYIVFKGNDISINVYDPDTENNDIATAEEYAAEVLKLKGEEGSGAKKYGKSSGYKAVSYDDNGNIVIDFIVKGVDAFYRFGYIAPKADFTEENVVFQTVMASIRIDDGIYNKLTRMSSRYTVLLEYATSMQYITDANYANHCLNNFDMTKDSRHKDEAITTSKNIRAEVSKIIDHEREADEGYGDMWNSILSEAKKIVDACERAEACVEKGDYEGAQKIARTDFTYTLSENCADFLSVINAEISEY